MENAWYKVPYRKSHKLIYKDKDKIRLGFIPVFSKNTSTLHTIQYIEST